MSTVIKQVDVLMTPVLATGLISPAVTAQHQSPRVAPAAGGQSRRPPLEPGCAGGSLIILKRYSSGAECQRAEPVSVRHVGPVPWDL